MARLIIVDDDAALRRMLEDGLAQMGHTVGTAGDADGLDRALTGGLPDLVILDVSLPGEDGISIARRLRRDHDFGIVMLTGADEVIDRVVGLEVGADDYVTKPFSIRELNARIEAVLRGRRFAGESVIPFGPLSLDLRSWTLYEPGGVAIDLFATEIDLVAAFATNPGKLLSRDDILRLAPAQGDDPLDRSVDTRVTRLRRKLEPYGVDGGIIEASRGNGYIYHGSVRA